jgi:hypothetical protein
VLTTRSRLLRRARVSHKAHRKNLGGIRCDGRRRRPERRGRAGRDVAERMTCGIFDPTLRTDTARPSRDCLCDSLDETRSRAMSLAGLSLRTARAAADSSSGGNAERRPHRSSAPPRYSLSTYFRASALAGRARLARRGEAQVGERMVAVPVGNELGHLACPHVEHVRAHLP